jgi:hypothetical protein
MKKGCGKYSLKTDVPFSAGEREIMIFGIALLPTDI